MQAKVISVIAPILIKIRRADRFEDAVQGILQRTVNNNQPFE